ncbi:MAG: hypothetical protein ACTH4I_02125, partial [Lactococcus cremoris]
LCLNYTIVTLRFKDNITPQSQIEENLIDFFTMSSIIWQLCKERFLSSFKEKVIYAVFNEQDEKF